MWLYGCGVARIVEVSLAYRKRARASWRFQVLGHLSRFPISAAVFCFDANLTRLAALEREADQNNKWGPFQAFATSTGEWLASASQSWQQLSQSGRERVRELGPAAAGTPKVPVVLFPHPHNRTGCKPFFPDSAMSGSSWALAGSAHLPVSVASNLGSHDLGAVSKLPSVTVGKAGPPGTGKASYFFFLSNSTNRKGLNLAPGPSISMRLLFRTPASQVEGSEQALRERPPWQETNRAVKKKIDAA